MSSLGLSLQLHEWINHYIYHALSKPNFHHLNHLFKRNVTLVGYHLTCDWPTCMPFSGIDLHLCEAAKPLKALSIYIRADQSDSPEHTTLPKYFCNMVWDSDFWQFIVRIVSNSDNKYERVSMTSTCSNKKAKLFEHVGSTGLTHVY
jgi:hypothetical protein